MVDVNYLSELAQMPINQKEAKTLKKGFEKTLESVDLLKKLDTTKFKKDFSVTGLLNIFRKDKIDKSRILTQDQALSNANKTYQGYFVVPRIINET